MCVWKGNMNSVQLLTSRINLPSACCFGSIVPKASPVFVLWFAFSIRPAIWLYSMHEIAIWLYSMHEIAVPISQSPQRSWWGLVLAMYDLRTKDSCTKNSCTKNSCTKNSCTKRQCFWGVSTDFWMMWLVDCSYLVFPTLVITLWFAFTQLYTFSAITIATKCVLSWTFSQALVLR